jgi:hypothetical protein
MVRDTAAVKVVEAMRFVGPILFWVGVFAVVREWLYARRHGLAITRGEKFYLALALPLIFGVQLVLDSMFGLAVALAISGNSMGVALNAWAIRRRIRRADANSRASLP